MRVSDALRRDLVPGEIVGSQRQSLLTILCLWIDLPKISWLVTLDSGEDDKNVQMCIRCLGWDCYLA